MIKHNKLIGITLIVMLSIGLVGCSQTSQDTLQNNTNTQDTELENINNNLSEGYNPEYTEFTSESANLEYILNSQELNITDSKNKLTLDDTELKNLNQIYTENNNSGVTRYQFASILYKIMLKENKLPDDSSFILTYEDKDSIPDKYYNAVKYTSCANLISFENKFDGYKFITKEETDLAFEKLNKYLSEFVEVELPSGEVTSISDDTEKAEKRKQLEEEAAEILKNRKFVDKLNGQSYALFKEPRTLKELEANQENVIKLDMDSIDNEKAFGNVTADYINLDQCLLDYSLLDEHSNLHDVVGVTFAKKYNYKEIDCNGIYLYQSDIFTAESYLMRYAICGVKIKDNKIVEYLDICSELGNEGIYSATNTEYDYLGIIVDKKKFETYGDVKDENITAILVVLS